MSILTVKSSHDAEFLRGKSLEFVEGVLENWDGGWVLRGEG
jgi:hypothetical protein